MVDTQKYLLKFLPNDMANMWRILICRHICMHAGSHIIIRKLINYIYDTSAFGKKFEKSFGVCSIFHIKTLAM